MLKYLSRFFTNLVDSYKTDYTPIYPYSDDHNLKRQQVWENLQHGLLLESTGKFVPWKIPYSDLDHYKNQRRDRSDRTQWYFGKHEILDGFELPLEAMKWSWISSFHSVKEIKSFLGFDYDGLDKFNHLKHHLTGLLGAPAINEIEKWGDFDLGTLKWSHGKASITLVGIEQFAAKYSVTIGM